MANIRLIRNSYDIILMLYTGIRLAEAIGLKWKSFNEKDNLLFINNSVVLAKNRADKENRVYSLYEQDTVKTKKGTRKIYLSSKALGAIKD